MMEKVIRMERRKLKVDDTNLYLTKVPKNHKTERDAKEFPLTQQ